MSIEAMKQALEALESERDKYLEWGDTDGAPEDVYEAITALRTAIAEAEKQEPVAWLHPANASCVTTDPTAYARGIPLYTTPPAAQRQWVGLTDDAIYAATEVAWRAGWAACRDAEFVGEEAEDEAWGYQGATVAQDIEAKLREKNGGHSAS